MVATHIISMNLDSLKDISFKAKYKRLARLLTIIFLLFQNQLIQGKVFLKMLMKKKLYFLSQIIKYRKINEYDLSTIINCDETAITFDSHLSYSLAKIGQKTITIKVTGKEKALITCLLSISADGEELKPYIIFKEKKSCYK